MPAPDPDRAVEVLDAVDCHQLMNSMRIGRLGYTRDALPAIAPVCFRVQGDQVIIPSPPGSPFLPGTRGAVVALEVDSFEVDAFDDDDDARTGWSVTVIGPARTVTDAAEEATLDALPWPRRAVWPQRRYISVAIGLIRGWRAVPEARAHAGARPAS